MQARVMAHLALSMISLAGSPFKVLKGSAVAGQPGLDLLVGNNLGVHMPAKQRFMTKIQVGMTSLVKTSVIVGPLPKSTWAASPGAKSRIQVAFGVCLLSPSEPTGVRMSNCR